MFHFVDLGNNSHTRDVAGCLQVGAEVQTAWYNFLTVSSLAGRPNPGMRWAYPTSVIFDEVRVAAVTITSPAPVVNGKPHPVNFDVATQYVPFPQGVSGGGGTSALPYEVACVLSLGTGARGKSQRGRTYIGPLDYNNMIDTVGAEGLFLKPVVHTLGLAFWTDFIVPLAADPGPQLQLVVASVKNATVRPVTNVRVGQVPDSQRRRRRSMPEDYDLAGGAL